MQKSFLDYYKLILIKVSFDYHLLKKEYKKAIKKLKPDEARVLQEWMLQKGLDPGLVKVRNAVKKA